MLRPEVADATQRVLERAGHEVSRPRGATCCGQPGWNAGFEKEARRVASKTQRALSKTDGPVVVPSGSCAAMMSHAWRELLDDSEGVCERVVELTTFLAPHEAAADTPGATTAVHDACHGLRELGIKNQPRALLAAAGRDVAEVESAERCCGFGGTFSVKLPEISVAMADDKLDNLASSGIERVVSCDLSCLIQLEGRAKRRGLDLTFEHIATALDDAD